MTIATPFKDSTTGKTAATADFRWIAGTSDIITGTGAEIKTSPTFTLPNPGQGFKWGFSWWYQAIEGGALDTARARIYRIREDGAEELIKAGVLKNLTAAFDTYKDVYSVTGAFARIPAANFDSDGNFRGFFTMQASSTPPALTRNFTAWATKVIDTDPFG